MSDVVLVSMPYAAIEHPSIALGYLQSGLKRRGISARTISANVLFAREIGIKSYFLFSNYYNTDLLGEWTFSEAAFPDFQPDHRLFFSCLKLPLEEDKIWNIRRQAKPFVDRLAEEILTEKPRIVGLSSVFQQNCASLALLRRLRELAPDVVTVMGGANCEVEMGRAIRANFPWVDYVFSGESDELFPEFCARVLSSASDPRNDGAWLPRSVFTPSAHSLGQSRTPERAVVTDLDTLLPLDYDDYFRDLKSSGMAGEIEPGLLVETSRGCWWGEKNSCTFCGLNGQCLHYRSKDPAGAEAEIQELAERYGIRAFEAVDNILDMSYFKSFLPSLSSRDFGFKFMYEIKVNLTRAQVKMLSQAGVRWVQPGIESLNDGVLKLLRKGNTVCQNLQLLKWAREYGIYVIWNYLCDVPGEKDEWQQEVLDLLPLILHLQPPSAPGSPLRFDRFSAYHAHPEKFGLSLKPVWTYSYIYPLPDSEIAELAYFFENTKPEAISGGQPRPNWEELRLRLVDWRERHLEKPNGKTCGESVGSFPCLNMSASEDGGIVLEDTRPCAPVARKELHGLAARVYEMCDRGKPSGSILKDCRERGYRHVTTAEVEQVLAEFMDARIMAFVSGRYLSLAVKTPCIPYAPINEFPGGRVHLKRARRIESPDDLTIADVFGVQV